MRWRSIFRPPDAGPSTPRRSSRRPAPSARRAGGSCGRPRHRIDFAVGWQAEPLMDVRVRSRLRGVVITVPVPVMTVKPRSCASSSAVRCRPAGSVAAGYRPRRRTALSRGRLRWTRPRGRPDHRPDVACVVGRTSGRRIGMARAGGPGDRGPLPRRPQDAWPQVDRLRRQADVGGAVGRRSRGRDRAVTAGRWRVMFPAASAVPAAVSPGRRIRRKAWPEGATDSSPHHRLFINA